MQPQLIAHRGYPHRYPENTLPAVEAALRAGARFVEIDVQLSAEGVPVVFHDRLLTRLCGVPGMIHERPLAALRGLTVRGAEGWLPAAIPTLDEVVALFADWPEAMLFVELKRSALEHFGVLEVFRRVAAVLAPLERRAVLISFAFDVLLVARWHGWPALGAVVADWPERSNPLLEPLAPEYLFCDVNGLPASGPVAFPGVRVVVYEVADPALARRLAGRGVDFIETFRVAEMLRALGGAADG